MRKKSGRRGGTENGVIRVHFFSPFLFKYQSDRTPLERFRLIANQVKNNLKWAKALDESKQEEQRSFVVEDHDGKEQRLTFDVNAFKANVQTVNALPPAAKIVLRKNPWERAPEDLAYVTRFVTKVGDTFRTTDQSSTSLKFQYRHYLNFPIGMYVTKHNVVLWESECNAWDFNSPSRQYQ